MSNDLAQFPEFGVAGIADSNLPKHPGLDDLFKKALLGELSRSRALKAWEPERLNETHLQIILLRAGGMRQNKIAEFLNATQGTHLTNASVSICCNHPDAITILTALVSYAADNVTDISAKIRAYAGEALETTVRIMRTTADQKLAARIGFDFLDRAGYGAVQKTENKQTTTIVMQPAAANNLASALRESQAEVSADYVMTGQQQLLGEGSGNALAPSESLVDSGLPVASAPPTSASLSPKPRPLPKQDEDDSEDFKALRAAKPLQRSA